MNWFSSYYWALIQNGMSKKMGNDYFVGEYYASKLTGYIFGSKISKLVKTKRLVAPMISLIVKQFGYGQITPKKTNYKEDWLTFEFYDPPVGRDVSKFFGFQEFPIDYSICGLVAGSAEQLIKRKFAAMETSCVGCGDGNCTVETLSLKHFKKKLNEIKNQKQKAILEKIYELEQKTDFGQEVKSLMKNRNKLALINEQQYLGQK
jgi:predicted hydrocarbon binding protein